MSDKTTPPAKPGAAPAAAGGTTLPVRRHPGHRGADVRDTVAEMAAKAHEISLEAGSKMAAAMKDVINAGAGLAAFSIESARDLVQFMVRRSQMTQDEADKLMASAEEASSKRKGAKKSAPAAKSAGKPKKAASKPAKKPASKKPAAKK
jgi:polyhydroxyalkanoate synthesis regulator phasin